MKARILIVLVIPFVCFSMEKQTTHVVRRKPRSLTETALLKQLEPISTKAQLEDLLKKIPQDLRCEVIKKSIHKKYLTQADLLELIKTYCSNNTLLRAYTYYTRITNTNRNKNTSFMVALSQYEEAKGNYDIIPLLNALIRIALDPEIPFSPIRILVEKNDLNNIVQLLQMGERIQTADLTHAISNQRAEIAQVLLDWGAPVDDPKETVYLQPLYQAFRTLSESMVKTLLLNGASATRKYSTENKMYSVPEELRLSIQAIEQSNLPIEGKTMEETKAYLSTLKRLLDTYTPRKKFNRLSA